MPIYEYRCTACGEQFEKIQKISDDALRDCPHCGQAALEKILSPGGVVRLKGERWKISKGKATKLKPENW